ncbi:UNVERIFIED_CONTAM: hypothetical protein Sangu_1531600 [Sesamum angustifolium]|uniref:Uncharacterized protein n=1 Tax=Sesamum angustifolium TaxID=2727405 RepID=A0AAW2MQW9_9LAMI
MNGGSEIRHLSCTQRSAFHSARAIHLSEREEVKESEQACIIQATNCSLHGTIYSGRFHSKRFVSASITHRVTCKQVAVAGTNSKDIKAALKSRSDIPACLAIGQILADRAREADVYTASYTPRKGISLKGK